jgi:hypothetical protein
VCLELELELALERADFEDHFLEFEESGLETFLRWDFLFWFVLLMGQLVQLVYLLQSFYLFDDFGRFLDLFVLQSLHLFFHLVVLAELVNHALQSLVLISGLLQKTHLLAFLPVHIQFHDTALADAHQRLQLFELVFE